MSGFFGGLASAVTDYEAGQADAAKATAATDQAAAAQTGAAADLLKGQGDILEGQSYGEAAGLATLNAQYATASTNIQEAQTQRQTFQVIGSEKADVAGAGLEASGSALDLLRSSTAQGALNHSIIASQGQINVAGYQEQAASYTNMQAAAGVASQAETQAAAGEIDVSNADLATAAAEKSAETGSDIAAVISGIGAFASLATGGIGGGGGGGVISGADNVAMGQGGGVGFDASGNALPGF